MESQLKAYCAKCKTLTQTDNKSYRVSKNDRPMMMGQCVLCGTRKSTFLKVENKTEEYGFSEPDSK